MRNALGFACLIALSVLALACESRVSLGGRCAQVAECATALTCVGELCREDCDGPEDCPAGQRCIAGPSGLRACSRPVEETCSATDPCNPNVFAECREGQCVTSCATGADCVSGTCDTSGGVGVCAEMVSTGGQDAGLADDAARTPDDAGDPVCLPDPPTSTRTIAEAVFGAGATASRAVAEVWLGNASEPLSLAADRELAIGVRAGGPDAPRVLAVLNQGVHETPQSEIAIRRVSPFATPVAVEDDGALEASFSMSALSVNSGPTFATFAVLRPAPATTSEAFAYIARERIGERSEVTGLANTRSTFPGRIALFAGPDVDFARELLLLDELVDGMHLLVLLGDPFGEGNRAVRDVTASWGTRVFSSMSTARQAVLLHDATTPRTALARCLGADPPAPLLSLAELDLVTDGAPALLATATSPNDYRVITSAHDCLELPIVELACPTERCTASTPTTAIGTASPAALAWETAGWGEASVVMLLEPEGARVVVLDADGHHVVEDVSLATTERFEIDDLSLREAHVAASVSDGVAALALGGLYVNAAGDGGQILVRTVRLTRP